MDITEIMRLEDPWLLTGLATVQVATNPSQTGRGEDTEASRALQHLGVGPQVCHLRFHKGDRERLVSCGTTPWW